MMFRILFDHVEYIHIFIYIYKLYGENLMFDFIFDLHHTYIHVYIHVYINYMVKI